MLFSNSKLELEEQNEATSSSIMTKLQILDHNFVSDVTPEFYPGVQLFESTYIIKLMKFLVSTILFIVTTHKLVRITVSSISYSIWLEVITFIDLSTFEFNSNIFRVGTMIQILE